MKHNSLFNIRSVPQESIEILSHFDEIVSDIRHLSGKQKLQLSGTIKKLSHELTDTRSSRRIGYMNSAEFISAYISYFMWWNLVRLVRLFANLPAEAFSSLDKGENPAVAIDVGSGPLTIPVALWLARPELRNRKITWYCMDLSQSALSTGEEIYLSVVAKTIALTKQNAEAWNIIRVKGPLGTSIKEKADFITSGNVFNEIIQHNDMPTDYLAKKYSAEIISYLKNQEGEFPSVLMIEPGDPHSARFISLFRDALIRKDYYPVSPCPHSLSCPMAGRTGGKTTSRSGTNSKWCNFAFSTEAAPKALLKLSEKAGLPKERAGLSFILSRKNFSSSEAESGKTFIRIASDFIRLPEIKRSAYYACSGLGLLLAVDEHHVQPENGELLEIKTPEDLSSRDKKSGGIIVKL